MSIKSDKIQRFYLILILFLMFFLTLFFYIKGRLTIHIQHSILISTLIYLEYFFIQDNGKIGLIGGYVVLYLLLYYVINLNA